MPQIVTTSLAIITDKIGYVSARKQADELSAEHGLTVADMPLVIQAMSSHPEIRKAIRPSWIDTITAELHGQRDGERSYEAWHSAGSLASSEGLEKAFPKMGAYGFMKVGDDEWTSVGKGSYDGKNVARIHLDDARNGKVPAPGIPHTIFVLLDKDHPNINKRGPVGYDEFMNDDRVLMITGSPENRERLAKILFGSKEQGGEGWTSVGSYHRTNEVGFGTNAVGRLVYVNYNYDGLNGNYDIGNIGRFAGVGAGGAAREKLTTELSLNCATQ